MVFNQIAYENHYSRQKYSFYCVLLLTLLGQNSLVYSQCPTVTNANQSFAIRNHQPWPVCKQWTMVEELGGTQRQHQPRPYRLLRFWLTEKIILQMIIPDLVVLDKV